MVKDRTKEGKPSQAGTDAGTGEPEKILIEHLRFDPENPRVVEELGEKPTQPQIESLLLNGSMNARELIPSFLTNGFIPYEPLIVRPDGKHYVVIEGNRRLAALRELQRSKEADEKKAFTEHKLNEIPCLVFKGDDRQLLAYLGLRHLSKTKDWSTRAKGAFVERVLRSGMGIKEAARITNTTSGDLRLILLTRRLFEMAAALGLTAQTADDRETVFWHLGDAIRRVRTKAYLELEDNSERPLDPPTLDQTRFENLFTWLYGDPRTRTDRIIRSIRDIGALDQCLGSEHATRVLESGGTLDEAEEALQSAGYSISAHIQRAERSVRRAIGGHWQGVEAAGIAEITANVGQLEGAIKLLRTALQDRSKETQTVQKLP